LQDLRVILAAAQLAQNDLTILQQKPPEAIHEAVVREPAEATTTHANEAFLPLTPVPISLNIAATPEQNETMTNKPLLPLNSYDLVVADVEKISFVFLNDYGGQASPLISAEFRAHAVMEGPLSRAKGELALSAEFYNDLRAAWEPLIEPWDMEMALLHAPGKPIEVQLSAQKMLQVVVNHALIAKALSIVTDWSADLKHLQRRKTEPFAPYRVENATGLPMKVMIVGETDTIQIPPFTEAHIGKRTRDTFKVQLLTSDVLILS